MKNLLKNTALIVLFGICFSKLAGYIYRIIISKLGPENYGTFILALSIISFSLIISKLGLDHSIQRYLPFYKHKKQFSSIKSLLKLSYSTALISSLSIALLIFLLSPYLSIIFKNPNLGKALIVLLPVIPIAALSFMTLATLKALHLAKHAVLSQYLMERIFLILTSIILLSLSFTLNSALQAYLLASSLTLITSLILLYQPLKNLLNKASSKAKFSPKEILNYSLPLMFSGITYLTIRYMDIILVGLFLSAEQVGFYDIAVLGALTLFIIPEAVLYIFTPKLSALHAKANKKEFYLQIKIARNTILFFNSILAIAIILFSPFLISLLLGKSYLSSSTPLIILTIGVAFRTFFLPYTSALSVIKRTDLVFKIDAISALANIILNLSLIPKFGLLGASIGTSLSYIIMGLLTISYYNKSKYV